MTLLAIDPGRSFKGEATIGVCLFTNSGDEIFRESVSWESLVKDLQIRGNGEHDPGPPWLSYRDYDVLDVVIEDFVNDPKSARGGQRNGTSECIGAVEYACFHAGVTMTRQEPRLLGPAKMHAGYEQTLKHLPHQDSAYLHGYEYLVRKGVLHPKGLADTLGST